MSSNTVIKSSGGCGCLLIAFNLLLGGWSVDYCLSFIFNKNIPWYADVLIGLFSAELTVPTAIILWILSFFGVNPPLLK